MFNLKETKAKRFYYNSLYYDFIFNFSRVRSYYFYDFHKKQDFEKRADDILSSYDSSLRQDLAEILEKTNLGLGCSDEVINNINKLRDKDTFIVIGGQQPGFFTGPVFIIYKILSIIKLSEHLSHFLKINTVPVFWNASDDSNFSQISSLFVLDGGLKKIELELPDDCTGISMKRFSDIFLPSQMFDDKLAELVQNLKITDFSPAIIDFLEKALEYAGGPGAAGSKKINPATFFAILVSRLFSNRGLIILDPSAPGLKRLLVSTAIFDLEKSRLIKDAVRKAGTMLLSQGYHEQLKLEGETLDFFMAKDGIRERVTDSGEGFFILGGARYEKAEIERLLYNNFRDITPNVILRPLFQDTILPVMATVCGPGEISYFSQLKEVYKFAGIKTGVLYPRFSATIIENKIVKAMKKSGIMLDELDCQKQHLLNRIISGGIGSEIDGLLQNFEKDLFLKLQALKTKVSSNALDVSSSFDRIERNLKKESTVLRKKIFSEIKEKDMLSVSSVDKIYSNVFPADSIQERIVNVFNYINKYGFYLLDAIYDKIDTENNAHRFMVFDDL